MLSSNYLLTNGNFTDIEAVDSSPKVEIALVELWNFTIGAPIYTSPAFLDINADENLEIVFGSYDCNIYCVNNLGTQVWTYLTSNDVVASPAVADINLDGSMDVVVANTDGDVYCLDKNGVLIWIASLGGSIYHDPIVVDIDIDGYYEILVSNTDDKLLCLNHMGESLWNATHANYIGGSPVVGNIDETPELEIIVPSTLGPICFNYLGILQYADVNWNMVNSQDIVLADLNNTGTYQLLFYNGVDTLVCVDATDPTEVYFQITDIADTDIFSSPVVADVNSDGKLEIMIHADKPGFHIFGNQGILYCINSCGVTLWTNVGISYGDSQPLIADIDNNNVMDIIITNTFGEVICFNNSGLKVFTYINTGGIYNTPLLIDINNDDIDEIICPCTNNALYCLGITDVEESGKALWSREKCSTFNIGQEDTDGDHIDDLSEMFYNSDPLLTDTDADELLDWKEIYCYGTNPNNADSDGDTISDSEEVYIGADGYQTNPLLTDTDGDGYDDNIEIEAGTDPTDPDDHPTESSTSPTDLNTLPIFPLIISFFIFSASSIMILKKKRV